MGMVADTNKLVVPAANLQKNWRHGRLQKAYTDIGAGVAGKVERR